MRPTACGRCVPALIAAASLGAAFPGTASGQPAVRFTRTVVVSPVPGDPPASGARLLARLAAITDANSANPYLLKVEPGLYDLGVGTLAMKPFVDVEGSGEGVTTVRSGVDTAGTVVGAANSELRRMTVENRGAVHAYALRNAAATFSLSHVTCVARGGSADSVAVIDGSPGATLTHVTARADGSPTVTGISSRGGLMRDVRASVAAGDLAYAIFNVASSGELTDVIAEAVSGRFAGAVRNEGGGPLLRNVRAYARGAEIGDGIVNGAGSNARIFGAVVHAVGGSFADGIRCEFSSAAVAQADIAVEALTSGFGVSSFFSGTPTLTDVTIRVTGGGNGVGVLAEGDVTASIDRATIRADGYSVANGFASPASIIRVGASRLLGPVRPASGMIRCVSSYDGAFVPLDASCAPAP